MLKTATKAALAAGEILKANYGKMLNVDEAKRHDVKLEVDRLCEQAIVSAIRAEFPDHAILAEEGGARAGEAPYRWIIDPLDGTVNFFYGLPYFCTSVACYETEGNFALPAETGSLGKPLVGVVYAPATDELFAAETGKGATMNGEPIHASGVSDLKEAIVATGFGSTEENIRRMLSVSGGLVNKVRKLRCLGAAAYDLANVAAGRLTGYYERGIRSWDIAAGNVLIKEAGGMLRATQIAPETWDVTAAGAGIFAPLEAEL
jgi:fructose-1,6-bisphosphatase/inositol monophosphatase family enzyme